MIDYYAAAISLMYIAFFEVVAIVWVYGANRLARNVRDMTGAMPNYYIRGCWLVAAPCLIMAIWIFSLVDYEAPTYNKGKYIFPSWSIGMGWAISSLSLIAIPVLAVVAVIRAKGDNIIKVLIFNVTIIVGLILINVLRKLQWHSNLRSKNALVAAKLSMNNSKLTTEALTPRTISTALSK